MAAQTRLSDLCGICNINKFKYCCPGCAARTCSLPCYKRHKTWAQCSGKRDPTKFVKKSQLATPAGVDHDYNFLSSIERGVDRAEKRIDELEHGSIAEDRAPQKLLRAFDNHYSAAGVTVIRAPKGMTRSNENKTHRSKRGKLVWTVEYIDENNSRILSQGPDSASVAWLYSNALGEKKVKSSKKRKNTDKDTDPAADDVPEVTNTSKARYSDRSTKTKLEIEEAAPSDGQLAEPEPVSVKYIASGGDVGQEEEQKNETSAKNEASDLEADLSSPERYFYLLKPRTASREKVLISLDSSSTLGNSLRNQLVLEFPTIYVLPMPPEQLPKRFMLEKQYMEQEKEEQQEMDELLKDPAVLKALKEDGPVNEEGTKVENADILDVLQKDIEALVSKQS